MNTFSKFTPIFMAAIFLAITALAPATAGNANEALPWTIDKSHSNINFQITHFFTPVSGSFHDYNADIQFDPNDLDGSKVDVEIMVNSIDTDNQKRDGHLKSDDFFNAAKYPRITFESNNITGEGNNRYVAHGKLTIKDVTKDVKLPFTLLGVQDHPMKENTKVAGIKIDHSIDRTDFNVGVGDWAATAVVGDNVEISIALELNSKSAG